ncbi:MAG: hypothetical protein AB7S86_16595 [Hydrogenophaga sp.]|uniref:hypothetical protein n=1 Tax=Hydrogenophaga sp. TaxID=1904254 RepID=UPI003D0DF7D4
MRRPAWVGGLLLLATGLACAQGGKPPKSQQQKTVALSCEAVYLPARTTWTRLVTIDYDQQRVRSVQIDGVPVYTFNVRDTVILTSTDNERIQIDTATQVWTSDFRGAATSQGRCERR